MPFVVPVDLSRSGSAIPSTGQTAVIPDLPGDYTLYLNPASLLATLSVTLPTSATYVQGKSRVIRVISSKVITLLTFTAGPTIVNAPGGMLLGDCITLVEVAPGLWHRAL